jgi:hypothetical protein
MTSHKTEHILYYPPKERHGGQYTHKVKFLVDGGGGVEVIPSTIHPNGGWIRVHTIEVDGLSVHSAGGLVYGRLVWNRLRKEGWERWGR